MPSPWSTGGRPIYGFVLIQGLFSGFALWWIPYLYLWTVLWGAAMLLLPRDLGRVKPLQVMLLCAAIIICAIVGMLIVALPPIGTILLGVVLWFGAKRAKSLDQTIKGVERIYEGDTDYKIEVEGHGPVEEMAKNINAQLETVGFVNLGVKARPNLIVLRRTKMPAVLVEVGFINSDTDNQLLDENMRDIAEAIAEGILDTLEYEGDLGGGTAGTAQGGPHYRVQAGAYRNRTYAQRLMEELMEYDIPAYIDDSGPFYLVQIGDYRDLDEAAAMEQRVKRAGYPAVIVKLPS